jgi:low affinity Fe/Cu permease
VNRWFHRFAGKVAILTGSWVAFVLALSIIVGWLVSGPFFGFSEVWQLVINTGTTIITFVMVFLIQHTQNVNDVALHKKLDEIIRGIPTASNDMIGIEQEEELGKS